MALMSADQLITGVTPTKARASAARRVSNIESNTNDDDDGNVDVEEVEEEGGSVREMAYVR